MKKVPIEEIIEQTKIEPYDKSTAAWCQILNTHRNATHQMLLDALKLAEIALVDLGACPDAECDCPRALPTVVAAIEAASFVDVEK